MKCIFVIYAQEELGLHPSACFHPSEWIATFRQNHFIPRGFAPWDEMILPSGFAIHPLGWIQPSGCKTQFFLPLCYEIPQFSLREMLIHEITNFTNLVHEISKDFLPIDEW